MTNYPYQIVPTWTNAPMEFLSDNAIEMVCNADDSSVALDRQNVLLMRIPWK
jgi:hypothetical protein